MPQENTLPNAAWRGNASANSGEVLGGQKAGRVLLLVESRGNRERLAEHLREQHELIEPRGGEFPQEPFDLALVDINGFRQWQRPLVDAKTREEPVFLPVVLVLSRRELKHRLRAYWDTIDEFIVTPVERGEFAERVALLLRARRLAVAQRAHLAYIVTHDRATGLPNKNLFMDRLNNAIRDASILGQNLYVTVIHIPLARVLKSLGHHGLERAAAVCSTRLRALLGNDYSLARLTTEEWGLIHRPGESMNGVLDVCERIRRLAGEPVTVGSELVHVAPRIGSAAYPDDAAEGESVLDCAISALSEAGGSLPVFYSREVQHQALRFIRTEARLHEALEKEQFELWYQPQLRLDNRETVGVEALVRWRLPNGKLVPPQEFMPVAEATGLVHDIDAWVLENACAVMRRWQAENVPVARVAVNVSAEDVKASSFVRHVERTLKRHRLPPPALELELTETTLFEISDENLRKLDRLRESGVSVAVDDFGTGYSSLSYLHRLPISTLKIDKSFVDKVDANPTNQAITRTIVWLARNFSLETVAEGIETDAQAAFLRELGVTTGQGYLYAKPMPEPDLRQWLSKDTQ